MDNFTDQKARIATEKDCCAQWGGEPKGKRFRCYLCGHKFKVGDIWRWVYAGGSGCINFLVCEQCDGQDVLDRWVLRNKEYEQLYWWKQQR